MKNIIVAIIALSIIATGAYYVISESQTEDTSYQKETPMEQTPPREETVPTAASSTPDQTSPASANQGDPTTIIGTSGAGRSIMAYHFGSGERELLLIGGIHGGYSWNTALLAYELIEWLQTETKNIPPDVRVTIIPTLNPDGLYALTKTDGPFTQDMVSGEESARIAARFNANTVDLNRNFDCEWSSQGTWQDRTVSGGAAPFSEPETQALAAYVEAQAPAMVVAWYSAAGGVYASACGGSPLPATRTITNTFAKAAGYPAYETFNYYEITGDMVNWFAKLEIPAISVLLTTHESTEFSKNKTGVQALIEALSKTENE